MRLKSILLLLVIVFITSNCKKDSLSDDLKGQWMRVDNNIQVLTFGYKGNEDWFTLSKGYRIDSDGDQRPIEFLGEYKIENQNDSISIHWMHSSLSVWPKFYFSFKGSKIEIGDLIDGTNTTIIFQKIK